MENKLHKTAKRLGSMWKASRQLQVGLILFLVVLLIAILANVLSPMIPIIWAMTCWCLPAARVILWHDQIRAAIS